MNFTGRADESCEVSIPKTPTGIPGVDAVLLGGVPRGRTTIVGGGPGSGKTLFALEFLYRGALADEPGVFVTFEEQAEVIRRNARAIGWDFAPLERNRRLFVMQADVPLDVVQSGDFDITGLLAILAGQIQALKARRIVIDAADVLLRLFRDRGRQEQQLFMLHRWLLEQGLTAVLTVKSADGGERANSVLQYAADCVLRLDQRVIGQVATRRLRVLKYRGSGFLSNEYPYIITAGGLVLMPISTVELAQQPPGPRFPTGVEGLDALLGGGFQQGSCILISGTSGAGKTTLACSLAVTACARDEPVLFVDFGESMASLRSNMASAGIDLGPALESGRLKVLTAMPEARGVEEHLWRIIQALDALKPRHLIVDAISACQRFGANAVAFDFLVRLLTECKTRGITCLYLNQLLGAQAVHALSGVGISSLADGILLLEQDWQDDEHRRRLLIVKLRGTRHSRSPHVFQVTDQGIRVGAAVRTRPVQQGEVP